MGERRERDLAPQRILEATPFEEGGRPAGIAYAGLRAEQRNPEIRRCPTEGMRRGHQRASIQPEDDRGGYDGRNRAPFEPWKGEAVQVHQRKRPRLRREPGESEQPEGDAASVLCG